MLLNSRLLPGSMGTSIQLNCLILKGSTLSFSSTHSILPLFVQHKLLHSAIRLNSSRKLAVRLSLALLTLSSLIWSTHWNPERTEDLGKCISPCYQILTKLFPKTMGASLKMGKTQESPLGPHISLINMELSDMNLWMISLLEGIPINS